MKGMKSAAIRALPPLVLALLALASGAAPPPNQASPSSDLSASARAASARPSFIVVLTDDQDLASLASMPKTKALIGDRGLSFDQMVVPLSLCCPARASILTGRYPHNHEILANRVPFGGFQKFEDLGRERETVAVALRDAGYRTAFYGKYLNNYPRVGEPTHVPPGWDEWASPAAGDPYSELDYTLNENGRLVPYGHAAKDYMPDVLAGMGETFVRNSSRAGKPFFLMVSVYAPHKPATPAARHAKLFRGVRAPRPPSFNEPDVADKPFRIRKRIPLKATEIAGLDGLYRQRLRSLQAVDDLVERMVQALAASGELDRTYLVFTSDNGFHLGQHRLEAGKKTPYEEDVRVPLLIRGPGIPAGVHTAALAMNIDLAPTLADLAGARLPVEPDGRSLAALWRSAQPAGQPPAGWRKVALLEQFKDDGDDKRTRGVQEPADAEGWKAADRAPTHSGLRNASYKYVEYGTGERELYDLAADPFELDSLHTRAAPQFLARLAERLQALSRCAGESCRELDGQALPALRARR
jgi:arylsulfatase A-like enzyme